MKNLFSLLEKFKNSLGKDALIKESVINTIKEKTKGNIAPEKINFKEGVLEIEAGSALKNEIKLKEELIKDELREVRGINIVRILYK